MSKPKSLSGRQFLIGFILFDLLIVGGIIWYMFTPRSDGDQYLKLINQGRVLFESGSLDSAAATFRKAIETADDQPDAKLNLAVVSLRLENLDTVLEQTAALLESDPNHAPALYLRGCVFLRKNQFEDASKALSECKSINPDIAQVAFQLGRAYEGLNQLEEAMLEYEDAVAIDPTLNAANYRLAQVYLRTDQAFLAQEIMRELQSSADSENNLSQSEDALEACVYTEIRAPFQLTQPEPKGVEVLFADRSEDWGPETESNGSRLTGPFALIDIEHDGSHETVAFSKTAEGESGLQILSWNGKRFQPSSELIPVSSSGEYRTILVGDLQNDRVEDIIAIGEQSTHVYQMSTNGLALDVTPFSGLDQALGKDAVLTDLEFTGTLDLLVTDPATGGIRMFRNLGNMIFNEQVEETGIPPLNNARQLLVDDWNRDDLMDVLISRDGESPLLLTDQRGAPLTDKNSPENWPASRIFTVGDLNNDLKPDLVALTGKGIDIRIQGSSDGQLITLNPESLGGIELHDYDQDGWLDLIAFGKGIRIWRNVGKLGFRETTSDVGMGTLSAAEIRQLAFVDIDNDGDSDWILEDEVQGLRFIENQGANANQLLKLRLFGNRSNHSGIGIRVEIEADGFRTTRTVRRLPVEIGVGNHQELQAVHVRWFDLTLSVNEVEVDPKNQIVMTELELPTGSCPYLYTWNGTEFEFHTDLLGGAPLGLPVAEGVYIQADPTEYVYLGTQETFPTREGAYEIRITEELREALYLDQIELVVADHPAGTLPLHNDKLRLPPYPESELQWFTHISPILKATRNDGLDVTEALRNRDQIHASPVKIREPQLRGLAEPYSFIMDFGPLDTTLPLAIEITGWLRFGGGMANIAASLRKDLPFPFPTLSVQMPNGEWRSLESVVAGAPIGKTKTIWIDLENQLPEGSQRLRWESAFEIHLDHVRLIQKAEPGEIAECQITRLSPSTSVLNRRGFSKYKDLPWTMPLTPNYSQVSPEAKWFRQLEGWVTRYGEINELVQVQDQALAIINAGDELAVRFETESLPELKPGFERSFFLYSVGWDKDADYHVNTGLTIEPLPWTGMNDQLYGIEDRPVFDSDSLMEKFNTRWSGSHALTARDREWSQFSDSAEIFSETD